MITKAGVSSVSYSSERIEKLWVVCAFNVTRSLFGIYKGGKGGGVQLHIMLKFSINSHITENFFN